MFKKECRICYDDEDDLLRLIEFYKPDVRILGDDYIGKRFTGDHLPIDVVYTTRAHGWSTTKIKDLIRRFNKWIKKEKNWKRFPRYKLNER